MTATMAAKDTNQLTRNKASAISSSYPLRQQPPFFQQQPTTQTTMATRAINIGFTGYTHAYLQQQQQQPRGGATNGEILNERVQRDEMVSNRFAAANAIGVVVDDDDEGNVDGTANVYKDSVASMAPNGATTTNVVVVDDINLAVDTCTGVPTAGGIEVDDDDGDDDDDDVDDDSDSFGSMETLSDNVAVWVDGERHWVAGVDANTTCAELIGALLNYQNAQQMQQKRHEQQQQQQQQQHMFNVNNSKNNNCLKNNNNGKANANTTTATTTANSFNTNSCSSSSSPPPNTAINQSMLIKTSTNTKENCVPVLAASNHAELTVGGCYPAALTAMALTVPATGCGGDGGPFNVGNHRRLAQACEYVIVKQHRHCEEYLDGNAKVFDVLPAHDGSARKEVSCACVYLPLSCCQNIACKMQALVDSSRLDSITVMNSGVDVLCFLFLFFIFMKEWIAA
ncbi:PREDICTED: ubiquitin carboxyl-terminal hydrolase 36-like [Rhagoletis zephyria]|uniref:ubiquitin carboxyl-terminal hydrolase 36-like n=1 Tax=Rhagoletis zephyria TaxID=28612 RepID=UPI0008116A86|nr:PREDICTED: ubiquitin carboxyl-terminal hydrolase 36-like [Rhagoletis zephyria]